MSTYEKCRTCRKFTEGNGPLESFCSCPRVPRCTGQDEFMSQCESPPEPGTRMCTGCREDIEWLHSPLTDDEEASIKNAVEGWL